MEVGIKKVLYLVLSVYIDNQDVSESRVAPWPRWNSNFRANADALDLAFSFSVLEQRIFKLVGRPFLGHCHFLEQIVTESPVSLARKTERHMRVFGQEILPVIDVAPIRQQIGASWAVLQ